MTRQANICIRLEADLKQASTQTLNDLGLTMSQAVVLFLRQVSLRQGLPFSVAMPNSPADKALASAQEPAADCCEDGVCNDPNCCPDGTCCADSTSNKAQGSTQAQSSTQAQGLNQAQGCC